MKLAENLTKKHIDQLLREAKQEENSTEDGQVFERIHETISKNGFLDREQLYEVARWKTPRASNIVKNNPDCLVRRVTALALETTDEKYKIRLLCTLDGFGIPRASAILTMSDPGKYGVIDVNAWFALTGREKHSFGEENWLYYLDQIRKMAEKHGRAPREIDLALMKYGQKLMKQKRKSTI